MTTAPPDTKAPPPSGNSARAANGFVARESRSPVSLPTDAVRSQEAQLDILRGMSEECEDALRRLREERHALSDPDRLERYWFDAGYRQGWDEGREQLHAEAMHAVAAEHVRNSAADPRPLAPIPPTPWAHDLEAMPRAS